MAESSDSHEEVSLRSTQVVYSNSYTPSGRHFKSDIALILIVPFRLWNVPGCRKIRMIPQVIKYMNFEINASRIKTSLR